MIVSSWLALDDDDKEWTHYYAQDIDIKCFYMTYIQTFLVGISAEVILGNTLAVEERRVWRTFGYYAHAMELKLKADAMLDFFKGAISVPRKAGKRQQLKLEF